MLGCYKATTDRVCYTGCLNTTFVLHTSVIIIIIHFNGIMIKAVPTTATINIFNVIITAANTSTTTVSLSLLISFYYNIREA